MLKWIMKTSRWQPTSAAVQGQQAWQYMQQEGEKLVPQLLRRLQEVLGAGYQEVLED
jgi:hypothetical protein